jgi:hypothetical protein
VIRLVEQARALDCGDGTLLIGANVDQLQRGAAFELRLQLGRRQLANRRELGGGWVIGQGAIDSVTNWASPGSSVTLGSACREPFPP